MERIKSILNNFDAFQQKHPVLGFPVAVIVKFNKDQAGNQAALLAYYAFLSLFPLLLVFFTLVPLVVRNDVEAQHRIIQAVLDYFPVIGSDLQQNIHAFRPGGLALFIGVLFALYGARGVANALQHVSNTIWAVPLKKRPGFPWNMLRSFGIIFFGGIGLVVTTVALGFVTSIWDSGWLSKAVVLVLALGCNTGIFLGISRMAVARQIPVRALLLGASISAVVWQILQITGSFLLLHQLKKASALYGVFALVLGLLFWLYLQAELHIYAMEISMVRHKKVWPRSFQQ